MYLTLGKLGAETKKLVAHQIFLFSKSLMCSHPRLTEKNVIYAALLFANPNNGHSCSSVIADLNNCHHVCLLCCN